MSVACSKAAAWQHTTTMRQGGTHRHVEPRRRRSSRSPRCGCWYPFVSTGKGRQGHGDVTWRQSLMRRGDSPTHAYPPSMERRGCGCSGVDAYCVWRRVDVLVHSVGPRSIPVPQRRWLFLAPSERRRCPSLKDGVRRPHPPPRLSLCRVGAALTEQHGVYDDTAVQVFPRLQTREAVDELGIRPLSRKFVGSRGLTADGKRARRSRTASSIDSAICLRCPGERWYV